MITGPVQAVDAEAVEIAIAAIAITRFISILVNVPPRVKGNAGDPWRR